MTQRLRPLGLLASLALALAARADTTLAPTSPFAPPDGAAAVATENQPLELRGIMQDGDGYRFSVYDPVKKSGQWVRLNEPGHDFTVKTHDAARDIITLDYQGRMLTLPLHSAKVVGVAVPEASTAPGPRPMNGQAGVGPQPKPNSPEEAARFNRAVEEINRRRALRDKSPGPTPTPMPTPTSGPRPQ